MINLDYGILLSAWTEWPPPRSVTFTKTLEASENLPKTGTACRRKMFSPRGSILSTSPCFFNPWVPQFLYHKRAHYCPLHRAVGWKERDEGHRALSATRNKDIKQQQNVQFCFCSMQGKAPADLKGSPPGGQGLAMDVISIVRKCSEGKATKEAKSSSGRKTRPRKRAHQGRQKKAWKAEHLELKIIRENCTPGTVFKEPPICSPIAWYNSTFMYFCTRMCLDPSRCLSSFTFSSDLKA